MATQSQWCNKKMIKKEGKIPVNARVDVDYSGKEPVVKFGYTSKNPHKDAYNQNFYGFSFLILFLTFFVIPYSFWTYYSFETDYPQNCSVELDRYDYSSNMTYERVIDNEYKITTTNYSTSSVRGANFTCDTGNYSVKFNYRKNWLVGEYGFMQDYRVGVLKLILVILIFFGMIALPFIINIPITKWLIKQKWYQKWLPKHMAGSKNKGKRYNKFKPKDVLDNTIVVPNFKNIELDYKTEGDFNKYLNKIFIREYRINKIKKGKVGKEKVDNFTWYAIFTFTQAPKNGYLEVIYQ